jgi:hypothetical protein
VPQPLAPRLLPVGKITVSPVPAHPARRSGLLPAASNQARRNLNVLGLRNVEHVAERQIL